MATNYHNRKLRTINSQLTHNLYFESASRAVSLCVTSDASVGGLVGHSFDVLDDQCSIGKDLLLPVDGQNSGVAFPDDALDRVTGDRARDSQGFPGDDGFLVHVTDEGKTVDVETGRVFSRADLPLLFR